MALIEDQPGPSWQSRPAGNGVSSGSSGQSVSSGFRSVQAINTVSPVVGMLSVPSNFDEQLAASTRLSEFSIQPQVSFFGWEKQLFGFISPYFPNANDIDMSKTVKQLYSVLNKESILLRSQELSQLSEQEFLEFVFERFAVRRLSNRGKLQSLQKGRMTFAGLLSLFKNYEPEQEKVLRNILKSNNACLKNTNTNTPYYRVGTFSNDKDELGRCQRAKKSERIFEEETVNARGTVYGCGLYIATAKSAATTYLGKPYNTNEIVCMLEIRLKDQKPIVPLLELGMNVRSAIELNKCHVTGILYQQKQFECLIKDEDIISSIKAFHPSIRTKIFIPFSEEEVTNKALFKSQIKKTDLDEIAFKSRCIGLKNVNDLDQPVFYQRIYEHTFKVTDDVWKATGDPYEYKYYYEDPWDNYVRVKPSATKNGQINHQDQFDEFHVQYKWPRSLTENSARRDDGR